MKKKIISKKIKRSSGLIDTFKINENSLDDKTKMQFQNLVTEYNDTVQLRNEIDEIKGDLATKSKEIAKRVKLLSRTRKIAEKALKRSKKSLLYLIPFIDDKRQSDGSGREDHAKTEKSNKSSKRINQKARTKQLADH